MSSLVPRILSLPLVALLACGGESYSEPPDAGADAEPDTILDSGAPYDPAPAPPLLPDSWARGRLVTGTSFRADDLPAEAVVYARISAVGSGGVESPPPTRTPRGSPPAFRACCSSMETIAGRPIPR